MQEESNNKKGGYVLDVVSFATLITSTATLATVAFLAYQIYYTRKQTHADFMFKLNEAFFFRSPSKGIIRALEEGENILKQNRGNFSEVDVDDFLGLIELMDRYRKQGVLATGDIDSMFGYYIEKAYENEEIKKYVENYSEYWEGFINLAKKFPAIKRP